MSMTIELPDTLVKRLRAAAAAEGKDLDLNNYAIARLERSLDTDTDDDLLECLRQGIADDDAGRTLSIEELDARVRATLARHNAEKASTSPQSVAG